MAVKLRHVFILANCIEAFIGALYLDLGHAAATDFITKEILVELPIIIAGGTYVDPKSKLQELVQEKKGITPNYGVISESIPITTKSLLSRVYEYYRNWAREWAIETRSGNCCRPNKINHYILTSRQFVLMP